MITHSYEKKSVIASSTLDRLLHHLVILAINRESFRIRRQTVKGGLEYGEVSDSGLKQSLAGCVLVRIRMNKKEEKIRDR